MKFKVCLTFSSLFDCIRLNNDITGGPPLPPGLPPPPVGMAPPLPPPASTAAVLIPQPKAMDSTLASASSVGNNNTLIPKNTSSTIGGGTGVSLSLDKQQHQQPSSLSQDSQVFKKKKIKDGLTLVYDAEQEVQGEGGEMKVVIRSMEERRSVSARYSKVMNICWEKRLRELQAV